MIKPIRMPELGTTVNEVIIERWVKKEGDEVKRGEILLVVETDKASMEVESYVTGVVKKILIPEGEKAVTGDEIAFIGNPEDQYEENPRHNTPESAPVVAGQAPSVDKPEIKVSPMVRKLAEKHGVDLLALTGSGPGGLILKEDVMLVAGGANISSSPVERIPALPVKLIQVEATPAGINPIAVPFSRIERSVARAMVLSTTTIPHISFSIEIDATNMQQARLLSGKKISYNAMLLQAVAACLEQYPDLASAYSDEGRFRAASINIGVAVSRGNDLLVPVVKHIAPGEASLDEIEKELQRLIRLVQSGQLKQDDISGGRFTISNLGAYGIDAFTAIINPPEAGILAVSSIKEKVVAAGGAIMIRPMMNITLSADHRLVNGVYAASFMQLLRKHLERM